MSMLSRRKGKEGERELVRLLREQLGEAVVRNLAQCREGGCDLLGIAGWAIECKRAKAPRLADWWAQTVAQATAGGQRSALAYRLNRQPWRVRISLNALVSTLDVATEDSQFTAEISLAAFVALVRETLP